jgi:hypothetical protein
MFTTQRTVDIKGKRIVPLKVVFACASALLMWAPIASAQSGASESRDRQAAHIEGTWILNINRVNQGITFSALMSFAAGGVTLATGTIDRTPPPPISPLYGSWRRVGHDSYVATICFFVFDTAGKAVAMIKTNETIQVDRDSDKLTGSGTGLACDIDGENCVDINSPITFTGKRLIAEGASN